MIPLAVEGFGSSRSAPMPRGDWQSGADAPGVGVQADSAEWGHEP